MAWLFGYARSYSVSSFAANSTAANETNAHSSDSTIIEMLDLRKVYSGWSLGGRRRIDAVRGVTLQANAGEVFGLLGPNGAGKTTLIKMLLGVVKPSGGKAFLFGQHVGSNAARARVGYLPESLRVDRHHTARSALRFYGRLSRMSEREIARRSDELLELVGLQGRDRESVRRFSKGMYQRLGLAQALMHDPDLLVLDEPTDGLDPVGRNEVRQVIERLRDSGKAIFLNSHILQEVELVCTRVAILAKGKIRAIGRLDELAGGDESDQVTIETVVDHSHDALKADLDDFASASGISELNLGLKSEGAGHVVTATVTDQRQIDSLVDWLRNRNLSIERLEISTTDVGRDVHETSRRFGANGLMGPYLAIIRDSFHSALSSRILWVAFAAIWLLLAGIAPIGYREDFTTTFLGRDFDNGTRLKGMLAEGLINPDKKETPLGRIAAALPEDLKRLLERVGKGDEVRIRYSALADGLNELLDEESWYDQDAWDNTLRLRELRDLNELTDQELSESLRRRRARLRIESALPGVFQGRSARSIVMTYAGIDFRADFQIDKPQFVNLINQIVIPLITGLLLGFMVVFLGILVTASIVPEMLQPGSLHLLLSKPISRSMLLLSKYVGGCAFVLLCVSQLVIGLYLIAGLRLDLWNVRILWCIPVSVFSFAVYYCVSVVAGLKWRSAILSIGITCMFGAFIFIIGWIGSMADQFVTRPDSIRGNRNRRREHHCDHTWRRDQSFRCDRKPLDRNRRIECTRWRSRVAAGKSRHKECRDGRRAQRAV